MTPQWAKIVSGGGGTERAHVRVLEWYARREALDELRGLADWHDEQDERQANG